MNKMVAALAALFFLGSATFVQASHADISADTDGETQSGGIEQDPSIEK